MDVLTAALMGLIQGITEWLPVSSTGHLLFAQKLAGIHPEEMIFFNLVLHAATLLSVSFFLRKDLKRIVPSMFRRKEGMGADEFGARRIGWFALLATVPIAIAGIIESLFLKELFSSPAPTAVALLITGVMLWVAENPGLRKERKDLRLKDAAIIGCFQAISVVPGISRSGTTISAGCYLGFKRDFVATFSFMLSIPAIILAFSYGVLFLGQHPVDGGSIAIGAAIAAITGVLALKWLFGQIQRFRLRWFAAYCWVVGAATLLLLAIFG